MRCPARPLRCTLGSVPRRPGRGGAFLPDTRWPVAHHLACPGEPWRI